MKFFLSSLFLQCYYIGGTSDAATGMLNEITKPMSYHKPPEKICEQLKTRDSQICELQYGKKLLLILVGKVAHVYYHPQSPKFIQKKVAKSNESFAHTATGYPNL